MHRRVDHSAIVPTRGNDTGLGQIFEAVQQLRGRCGPRQVDGARLALTQNAGGWLEADKSAISIHVLGRTKLS